jgi:hypothetical protein
VPLAPRVCLSRPASSSGFGPRSASAELAELISAPPRALAGLTIKRDRGGADEVAKDNYRLAGGTALTGGAPVAVPVAIVVLLFVDVIVA